MSSRACSSCWMRSSVALLSSAQAFRSAASVISACCWAPAAPLLLPCCALPLVEMVSRLYTARSMSWISFSWMRRSSACRSFMRWISFFMAPTTSLPTLGSIAACISFSSVILRSQSMICRSTSTISARHCFLSSCAALMRLSILLASASSSLSSVTIFVSRLKLSFARSPWSSVFLEIRVLRRVMSLCMCSTAVSSPLMAVACCSYCCSRRAFF
mmetsp:Transcript_35878/g.113468  ORF Transcript_35878/g.113468 Transcript_35878/m.113468 type:complete len:215 (-) Transcript_35878:1688-2332(-)